MSPKPKAGKATFKGESRPTICVFRAAVFRRRPPPLNGSVPRWGQGWGQTAAGQRKEGSGGQGGQRRAAARREEKGRGERRRKEERCWAAATGHAVLLPLVFSLPIPLHSVHCGQRQRARRCGRGQSAGQAQVDGGGRDGGEDPGSLARQRGAPTRHVSMQQLCLSLPTAVVLHRDECVFFSAVRSRSVVAQASAGP